MAETAEKAEAWFWSCSIQVLEVARSDALYDLEKTNKIKHYEIEARSVGASFRIIFRDKDSKRFHKYVITRTCNMKEYRTGDSLERMASM